MTINSYDIRHMNPDAYKAYFLEAMRTNDNETLAVLTARPFEDGQWQMPGTDEIEKEAKEIARRGFAIVRLAHKKIAICDKRDYDTYVKSMTREDWK